MGVLLAGVPAWAATLVIELAVKVLKYYQERADFREKVLLEVENACLHRVAEAARLVDDSPESGTLRVRQPKRRP